MKKRYGPNGRPSRLQFIKVPWRIWEDGIDLSLAEFRLLGYLVRHQYMFGNAIVWLTDEELRSGRRRRGGARMDVGAGVSRNALRRAREALIARRFIEVVVDDSDRARMRRGYRVVTDVLGLLPLSGVDPQLSRTDDQVSEMDPHLSESDPQLSTTDPRTHRRRSGRGPERGEGRAGSSSFSDQVIKATGVVTDRLNSRTGSSFDAENPHYLELVEALMEPAGDCRAVTEDELRAVVWDRCNRWLESPEMREHLCPTTLFRPRKFFDYLAIAIPAREAYLRESSRPRLEVVR